MTKPLTPEEIEEMRQWVDGLSSLPTLAQTGETSHNMLPVRVVGVDVVGVRVRSLLATIEHLQRQVDAAETSEQCWATDYFEAWQDAEACLAESERARNVAEEAAERSNALLHRWLAGGFAAVQVNDPDAPNLVTETRVYLAEAEVSNEVS